MTRRLLTMFLAAAALATVATGCTSEPEYDEAIDAAVTEARSDADLQADVLFYDIAVNAVPDSRGLSWQQASEFLDNDRGRSLCDAVQQGAHRMDLVDDLMSEYRLIRANAQSVYDVAIFVYCKDEAI